MAIFVLYEKQNNTGMIIGGSISSKVFRDDAREHGADESLVQVDNPEGLLDPEAIKEVVRGAFVTAIGLDALNSAEQLNPSQ